MIAGIMRVLALAGGIATLAVGLLWLRLLLHIRSKLDETEKTLSAGKQKLHPADRPAVNPPTSGR